MNHLTEIGKAVGLELGSIAFNALAGRKYGEATEAVNAILNAVEDLKKQIQEDIKVTVVGWKYNDLRDSIDTRLKVLKEKMDEKSRKPDSTSLDDFIDQLGRDGQLRIDLTRMHTCMMGGGDLENAGFIELYMNRCNDGVYNQYKSVSWYLHTVDQLMAAQVRRQLAGLMMLQLTAKGDIPTAKSQSKEFRGNIAKQLEAAYSYFPPLVKMLKPNMTEPIAPNKWWRIIRDPTAINDSNAGDLTAASSENHNIGTMRNIQTPFLAHWRFAPAFDDPSPMPGSSLEPAVPQGYHLLVNRAYNGPVRAYLNEIGGMEVFVSQEPPLHPGPHDSRVMTRTKRIALYMLVKSKDKPIFEFSISRATLPEHHTPHKLRGKFRLSDDNVEQPAKPYECDHFYTTDPAEAQRCIPQSGAMETPAGYVFTTQIPGTVPFYRSYGADNRDHFYTQKADIEGAWEFYDYKKIACYLYPTQQPGTTPLHRFRSEKPGTKTDHLYTLDWEEVGRSSEWVSEGVAGYVFGQYHEGAVPFLRLRLHR